MVPACRTLDAISIFALTAADAHARCARLHAASMRTIPGRAPRCRTPGAAGRERGARASPCRSPAQLRVLRQRRICAAVRRQPSSAARALGGKRHRSGHRAAAARPRACCMKAHGWRSATWPQGNCCETRPDALHPVTRAIIEGGAQCQRARRIRARSTACRN